jgi:ATP-dependent exoDNAse (exonuclease V) alpha subunit
MVLQRMTDRVLEVQLIGGEHHDKIAFIPRITVIPSSKSTGFSFTLRRRQFPVRLAFAITINKAQGQSVKMVGLDLRVPVFSHGQLYVALSRSTSSQRIKILLSEDDVEIRTSNIVFPEVLLD